MTVLKLCGEWGAGEGHGRGRVGGGGGGGSRMMVVENEPVDEFILSWMSSWLEAARGGVVVLGETR